MILLDLRPSRCRRRSQGRGRSSVRRRYKARRRQCGKCRAPGAPHSIRSGIDASSRSIRRATAKCRRVNRWNERYSNCLILERVEVVASSGGSTVRSPDRPADERQERRRTKTASVACHAMSARWLRSQAAGEIEIPGEITRASVARFAVFVPSMRSCPGSVPRTHHRPAQST